MWVNHLANCQVQVVGLPGAGHYPTLAGDARDFDGTGPWHPLYEQTLRRWGAQLTRATTSHPHAEDLSASSGLGSGWRSLAVKEQRLAADWAKPGREKCA